MPTMRLKEDEEQQPRFRVARSGVMLAIISLSCDSCTALLFAAPTTLPFDGVFEGVVNCVAAASLSLTTSLQRSYMKQFKWTYHSDSAYSALFFKSN